MPQEIGTLSRDCGGLAGGYWWFRECQMKGPTKLPLGA
jgi:hypothetical protein